MGNNPHPSLLSSCGLDKDEVSVSEAECARYVLPGVVVLFQ